MSTLLCPFCNTTIPACADTYSKHCVSFSNTYANMCKKDGTPVDDSTLQIAFYKCPTCNEYIVKACGIGTAVKDTNIQLRPLSPAKHFPSYVPESIRQDYEEACSIVSLSPKASATLSRRCLQGMIRDFWGISKPNLYKEIDELKDKIPGDLWSCINALRQLGNIGAHMEKDTNIIIDIDSNEANYLIRLIELLMKEWYINREERQKLFSNIISTNKAKQSERKKRE